jgi:hypothetical protein
MQKGDAERADSPVERFLRGTKWDFLVGFDGLF